MPEESAFMQRMRELGGKPMDPAKKKDYLDAVQNKVIPAILNDKECLNQARQMIATHAHAPRRSSRRED